MDNYSTVDAFTVYQSETDDRYARVILMRIDRDYRFDTESPPWKIETVEPFVMFYLDYELNFGATEDLRITAILETVGENEDRMQHHDSDTIYFDLGTDNEIEARRKYARAFLDITELERN